MKRTIITIALSLVPAMGHAAPNQHVTDYCLFEPWDDQGDSGFIMKARLTINGSHYILNAWNVMPDNSQTLEVHANGTYNRNGPTRIRFIDNFGNHGRGTFTANRLEMQINIDRVKATDVGRNIGRNYGSYKLKSRGCKWYEQ